MTSQYRIYGIRWTDLALWTALAILIIILQINGYYNRVYVIHRNCENTLAIQKTNQYIYEKHKSMVEMPILTSGTPTDYYPIIEIETCKRICKWNLTEMMEHQNQTGYNAE